ncbi:hypothetical protein QL996_10775 [Planococcus sp. APC 4015]|nr:hypothetical protein [Planococcus sp. APC 4015]
MTAYPAWTPASRPGIVPLHPLSFGTILGRSFVALRQNPRVLLGFALVVQTVAYLVVLVALGFVTFGAFSRLDTLRPGTDEFETVMAGSVAIVLAAGLVLGLASGALTLVVQGVVVVEVTRAVVAERLTLGALWQRVKPAIWRLIGYSLLVVVAAIAALGVLGAIVAVIAIVAVPLAIALAVMVVLALIPLVWWLMIKLLLVPAVILIEGATIRAAIARSWTLVRGRFWSSLGVIVLISMIFGVVSQAVSLPFSFLSAGLSTVIAPTGEVDTSGIITLVVSLVLAYAVLLLLQSIAVVVQSTATALIYVDCRMRREGLDLDLLEYVEKRDAGVSPLPDPYRQSIGRDQPSPYLPPAVPMPYPGPPAAYAPPPASPAAPPYAYPPQAAPGSASPAATPSAPPAPTQWAAPGSGEAGRPAP